MSLGIKVLERCINFDLLGLCEKYYLSDRQCQAKCQMTSYLENYVSKYQTEISAITMSFTYLCIVFSNVGQVTTYADSH